MNMPLSDTVSFHESVSALDRNCEQLKLSHIVQGYLDRFPRHSLKQQDEASLLERRDEKFVVSLTDLPKILREIHQEYSALNESGVTMFSYTTRYFDTPSMQCYHEHHNTKSNRFKLRIRSYDDSNLTFVECKIKNNKGQTQKLRRVHEDGFSLASASDFLFKNIGKDHSVFQGMIDVHYYRITLMNRNRDQRITIDLNLSYKNLKTGKHLDLNELAVIEIKQQGKFDYRSQIQKTLKKLRYAPMDFSKYCMGCVLTEMEDIKMNRFKLNLLYIDKLKQIKNGKR